MDSIDRQKKLSKDEPNKDNSPLKELLSERLAHRRYDKVYAFWEKAITRLEEDTDGAVTAARAMIETTAKLILDELGEKYEDKWELPRLYDAAAATLGISPRQQADDLFRAFFGSCQTIVNRIGEMRNKFGDAHGKGHLSLPVPRHHAELAVNLAGSICSFLIPCFESYIASQKLRTLDGEVILRFDATTVWRMVDHARNSKKTMDSYGKKKGKCLLLVGDSGVYLMSNGLPAMDSLGRLIIKEKGKWTRRLVAHALGCDPAYNMFEDWWAIHHAIMGGDDFTIPISIKMFEKILPTCDAEIVVIVDKEGYAILSDKDFQTR